jgi:hypothetical protein
VAEPIFKAWIVVFDKLKKVIVDNKDNFQAFFDVVKFLAPIIGKVIGAAVTVIGDVAEVVLAIFAKVLGALKPLINGAIDGINAIISAYNRLPFGDISLIPKIGSTGGASTGTPGAISGGGAKTGTVTGTGTGGTGGAVAAAVAGAVTAGVKAGAAAAAAANPFAGLGLGTAGGTVNASDYATRNAGMAAITAPVFQSALTQSAAIRRAEAATASPTINITVNGATNSEDAARVIVDTLNRSTYRGTGGSSNLVTIA